MLKNKSKKIKTLAIETSCDDTSLAVVVFENGNFQVEKILSYTQAIHQKYGGVVPELASREHSSQILELLKNFDFEDIDFFSVTAYPGLPGSLMVGTTTANFLSSKYKKPLINVNHINGHIFSGLLERNIFDFEFPQIILSVSGGHNDLYLIQLEKNGEKIEKFDQTSLENLSTSYKFLVQKIGYSLDDAAGECFDKVSRMLSGPYPGGKFIGDLAEKSEFDENIKFKRVYADSGDYNFSFSGFKSQVQNYINKLTKNGTQPQNLTDKIRGSIAKEFEQAVVEILTKKTLAAASEYNAKMIGLVGGVSANAHLRQEFEKLCNFENFGKNDKPKFYSTSKIVYSTDNGAMIGVAGILEYLGLI